MKYLKVLHESKALSQAFLRALIEIEDLANEIFESAS